MPSGFVTLKNAVPFFCTRPHHNTVIRWARKGLYGKKLKTVRYGGKRLTCKEWCDEFSSHLMQNSPTCSLDEDIESTSASAESAEAKLDAMGIV